MTVTHEGKDFERSPELGVDDPEKDSVELELFGKKWRMANDAWRHHVHLKCSNRCDGKCAFCSEKDTWKDPENASAFFESVKTLLDQMKAQKALETVSITGGEPTGWKPIQTLVDVVQNEYSPRLFSMNSNGAHMLTALKPKSFQGWLDLSKHAVDDTRVMCRPVNVTPTHIRNFKKLHPLARVRVQCVLGASPWGLKDMDEVFDFVNYFRRSVDNFSFRSLIIEKEDGAPTKLLTELREFLFANAEPVEQRIQDYYVYEIYRLEGAEIMVAWSYMNLLRKYYSEHPESNFLQEIIVHPDGVVSGSWDRKTQVIYDPTETRKQRLKEQRLQKEHKKKEEK